jgi:hypothetical protein
MPKGEIDEKDRPTSLPSSAVFPGFLVILPAGTDDFRGRAMKKATHFMAGAFVVLFLL